MQIDWAILAQSVEGSANGPYRLLSAGFDEITYPETLAPAAPGDTPKAHLALAFHVTMERAEVQHPHDVRCDILDQDGRKVTDMQLALPAQQLPVFWPFNKVWAFTLGLAPLSSGIYALVFWEGQFHLKTLAFRIRSAQQR